MRSIQFPNIFNYNNTNVIASNEYNKSTLQNAKLLLNTTKGEMFGDPYIGTKIKQYLFDQNNYILREALIDNIYTQLALFIPQLKITRKDITIESPVKGKLVCKFSGINQIDFTVDTYNIVLINESEI